MTGSTALNVGSDRQLFVDDYLIESMSGAELRLHSPASAGSVLSLDMPWEGVTCDYHTVFQDDGVYRMYYRGSSHEGYTIDALLEPGEESVPVHHENVCYAESRDGITWTRPSLGLIEFEGSKVNNIVWLDEDGDTTDLVPFLDGNPEAAEDEKYKGIVWKGSRVFAVASDDAVTWRFMRDEPILTERPFDSQNVPFWDPWKGEYAIFTRGKIGTGGSFGGGYRWIRRATSPDFLTWSPLELIDTGDTPHEHLYTNGTTPYSRAPGVYLAFPRRFSPQRKPREDSPWPGTADSVFMSSRDGLQLGPQVHGVHTQAGNRPPALDVAQQPAVQRHRRDGREGDFDVRPAPPGLPVGPLRAGDLAEGRLRVCQRRLRRRGGHHVAAGVRRRASSKSTTPRRRWAPSESRCRTRTVLRWPGSGSGTTRRCSATK